MTHQDNSEELAKVGCGAYSIVLLLVITISIIFGALTSCSSPHTYVISNRVAFVYVDTVTNINIHADSSQQQFTEPAAPPAVDTTTNTATHIKTDVSLTTTPPYPSTYPSYVQPQVVSTPTSIRDTIFVAIYPGITSTTEIVEPQLSNRQLLLIALGKWMIATIVLFLLFIACTILGFIDLDYHKPKRKRGQHK